MKRLSSFCVTAICGLTICGAGFAAAQQQPETKPVEPRPAQPAQPSEPAGQPAPFRRPSPSNPPVEVPPEMKAIIEANKPGEQHKKLEQFAGFWDGSMKMWMDPAQPPTESKSTVISRMDMDGRFLEVRHTGNIMGMPFRGVAIWGYNTKTGKFESTWRDNMTTGMTMSHGEVSADGKTFTFTGEMDDQMGGSEKIKFREVFTFTTDSAYTFEMYETRDGKEHKALEATYTKRAQGARPAPGGPTPLPAGRPTPPPAGGGK